MEYIFNAGDGTRLVARSWEAEKPRGTLLVVHGLGEYGSKYVSFSSEINKLGYTVCAVDLRGFGFSSGRRGHAPSMEILCDDLEAFLDATRKYYQAPFFLLGHSVGGTLVSYAACSRRLEVKGIILSSPMIGKGTIPGLKWRAVSFLGAVFPILAVEFDSGKIETGQKKRPLTAYADRNQHQKVTAGLFREFEMAARFVEDFPGKTGMPLLGIHGQDDRITDPAKTEKFVSRQGGIFLFWPGGGHILHRGGFRKKYCREIADWMERYNPSKG